MIFLRLQQILIIFILLFVIISQCASQPTAFEIDQQIDLHFRICLFSERLTDEERAKAAVDLAMLQFMFPAYDKFDLLEEKVAQMEMPKRKVAEIRNEHNLLLTSIKDSKFSNSLQGLCQMWEIQKRLDFFLENPAQLGNNSIGFMRHAKFRFDDCDRLFNIGFEEKHKWPPSFEKDLSKTFLAFLEKMFYNRTQRNYTLKEWLTDKKMQNEGELTYWLRMSRLKGNLGELNEVKRKLVRYLLTLDDLELLESKFPLIMSIDVISSERLKLLFMNMFNPQNNSVGFSKKNLTHLRMILLFGNIFTYFSECKQSETYEKLWKLFERILLDISELNIADEIETNSIKALENILKYLQNEIGQISAKAHGKYLLLSCINQFLMLCYTDAKFFDNIRKMSETRIVLRQIFEFASEGMGKVISDRFWEWLNDPDKNKLQNFDVDQQNVEEAFTSNVNKLYDECPKENMSYTELLRTDNDARQNDPEAVDLMNLYIDLLKTHKEKDPQSTVLLRKIELEAAVWYYREHIRELFHFGNLLAAKKDDHFMDNFKTIKLQFEQQQIAKVRRDDADGELCRLYKIAHKITQMKAPRVANEAWREHIEQLTNLDTSTLFDERLIILPNDNENVGEIRWDEIECQNAEITTKLKGKLLECPDKIKRIHITCLDKLIKRFKRLQSFFCYGVDELLPVILKEKLRIIILEGAFNILESKNPEILHFDIFNVGMFTATFLSQLKRKSGTIAAESYEARIYLPIYVSSINAMEKSLYQNSANLDTSIRKACLEKIIKTKNEFYSLIASGKLDHLRKSHCKLFQFEKFMDRSIAMSRDEAMIEQWEPKECQNESVVKATLLTQRKLKKWQIYETVKQILKKEVVTKQLRECRGCYSRLKRYFDDENLFAKLLKKADIVDHKVFDNDHLLKSHYIEAMLTSDDDNDDDDTSAKTEALLMADFMIFIRWMDSTEFEKQNGANELVAKRIARVWNNSIRQIFANVYDQIYDETAEQLKEGVEILRTICANSKNYFEKTKNSKKVKTEQVIFAEWTKNLGNTFGDCLTLFVTKKVDPNLAPSSAFQSYTKWIQNFHCNTIKRFIDDDTHFSACFKKVLEHRNGANKLVHFLNKENALSILCLLQIQRVETVSSTSADGGASSSSPMRGLPCLLDSQFDSASSSTVGSPTAVGSPTVDKKKSKRKKTKKNKNNVGALVESPSSAAANESDEFLTNETPKKDTEIEEEQILSEEEKVETVQEDEAFDMAFMQEHSDRHEAVFVGEPADMALGKEQADHDETVPADEASHIELRPKQANQFEAVLEDEPADMALEQDDQDEAVLVDEASHMESRPKQANQHEAVFVDEPADMALEQEQAYQHEVVPEQSLLISPIHKKEVQEDDDDNYEDDETDEQFSTDCSPASSRTEMIPSKRTTDQNEEDNDESLEANFEFSYKENSEVAEIEEITIGDISDRNILLMKYSELISHIGDVNGPGKRKLEMPKLFTENTRAEKQVWRRKTTTISEQNASVRAIVHLLDVGAYANEIWHRLKAIRHVASIWPAIGIHQSDVVKMEKQWSKIKAVKMASKMRWTKLEKHLHKLLKQLLILMDKKKCSNAEERSSDDELQLLDEIRVMKDQLHMRNLALLLSQNNYDEVQQFWFPKMGKTPKMAPICSLLFSQSAHKELYDEYRNNGKYNKFIVQKMAVNFVPAQFEQISELWQQIDFVDDRFKQLDIHDLENEILKWNKYLIFDFKQKQLTESVIEELRKLLANWSSQIVCDFSAEFWLRPYGEAKLDAVCLMPAEFDVTASFLGGYNFCNFDKRNETCGDTSLYCKLCNDANVLSLRKTHKNSFTEAIPQLQFCYKSVQLIVFAILVPNFDSFRPNGAPSMDSQQINEISQKFGDEIDKLIRADHLFDEGKFRSDKQLNNETLELLSNSLIHSEAAQIMEQMLMFDRLNELFENDRQMAIRQRESVKNLLATLKELSRFGMYAKIFELVSDNADSNLTKSNVTMLYAGKITSKFGLALAYLEQWAKSSHIVCKKMGYLDFTILTIMVTKTMLAYPNVSLPLLIEKFFIQYSTWQWPLPIQLTEIDFERRGEFLSWMPGREWFIKRQHAPKKLLKSIRAEMTMAIITPTFPEQNLTQNSNLSAVKCLQNHMIKALKKIRNESDKNALIRPLKTKEFSKMYEHFIVINCAAPKYQIEHFANFVGTRLGHELAHIENSLQKWIKFCHVFAKTIPLGECSNTSSPKSPPSYCKQIWLIGMELNEAFKELGKFERKLKEHLKEHFDETIKADFDGGFVEIESEYVNDRSLIKQFLVSDLSY